MICQYNWCYQASTTILVDYKIVSSCTDYVTDYKVCNILCLNKYTYTFFYLLSTNNNCFFVLTIA